MTCSSIPAREIPHRPARADDALRLMPDGFATQALLP